MTISVEDIKKEYPQPVPAKGCPADKDGYCVGGALCRYATKIGIYNDAESFPAVSTLASALWSVNPALNSIMAHSFARKITEENDHGNFDLAWGILREALTYNGSET